MDQSYEGDSDRNSDEESGSTDTTLDSSCSLASSQGSTHSLHCYSSGCCASNGSWADQCLSKDGGNLASMDEENASHGTTDENDGEKEKPATPLASCKANWNPWKSHWRRQRSQRTPTRLPLLQVSPRPPTARIM